jgi:hypothetical protein
MLLKAIFYTNISEIKGPVKWQGVLKPHFIVNVWLMLINYQQKGRLPPQYKCYVMIKMVENRLYTEGGVSKEYFTFVLSKISYANDGLKKRQRRVIFVEID